MIFTGLYNRRGFLNLAEHHLETARRGHQSSLLIYADLDGLKQINDSLGHSEGSSAIIKTAEVLRRTFRTSDIVSRLGGDEFVVIAQNVARDEVHTVLARLEASLHMQNETEESGYRLSLSTGVVWIAHDTDQSIVELIDKADQAMYDNKRSRKQLLNSRRDVNLRPAAWLSEPPR